MTTEATSLIYMMLISLCVYVCAKFMCHVNWWQILFSQLPVDALFCLPTDGAHWTRSNQRTNERNIYGRFSWLFLYLIPFHLCFSSICTRFHFAYIGLGFISTFDFESPIYYPEPKWRRKKQKHLRSVCVLTFLKWQLYGDGNAIVFCFYLPFDDCSIFIQWFQSNFCIIALRSPATECVGVRKRKQK